MHLKISSSGDAPGTSLRGDALGNSSCHGHGFHGLGLALAAEICSTTNSVKRYTDRTEYRKADDVTLNPIELSRRIFCVLSTGFSLVSRGDLLSFRGRLTEGRLMTLSV